MKRPTTPGRILATLAGAAFAVASLTILLDKQLLQPVEWTSAQWLTILMVFGVLAAGHLMVTAWKANHLPSAGGFLVLFVVGTGLVVYSSVGRQIETAGLSTMSAEDLNAAIADKRADLKDARERLAYANGQVRQLMAGKACSSKACRDWRTNAKDVTAAVKALEVDIADLGPRKPVNAQAEAMADILLLFPFRPSRAQLVALLTLLVPFAKTLFFEIGAIVSLGFAFRPMQARIPAKSETPRIPGNGNSRSAGPTKPPKPGRGRKADPKIIEFQERFRERQGHAPSAGELKSAFPGIATSTAYSYAARSRKSA